MFPNTNNSKFYIVSSAHLQELKGLSGVFRSFAQQGICCPHAVPHWYSHTSEIHSSQKHMLKAGFCVNRSAVLFSPKYTWHLRALLKLVCVE